MRRCPVGASAANSSRNLPCSSNNSSRPVAEHPVLELLEMFGILEIGDRHLMRAPGAFDRLAVDEFRAGPALGRAEHDHRPARALRRLGAPAVRAALWISRMRARIASSVPARALMHQRRIVALDEMRIVAVAAQQLGQFLAADARQHGRIGDLEAVEMQDRQHRAVARGVEELVGVPARRQRRRSPPRRRR